MARHFLTILISLILCTPCTSYARQGRPITASELQDEASALGIEPTPYMIVISTSTQTLTLLHHNKAYETFTIATGRKGLGQHINTFKTPLGLHRINEKIGHEIPEYGIFIRRQYVGTWDPLPRHLHRKDFVSTRILRLEGLQPGFNKGLDRRGRVVDTEARAVYIHGTTMEWKLGYPSTKGCIHMKAKDIRRLFEKVPLGTLVWITPKKLLNP